MDNLMTGRKGRKLRRWISVCVVMILVPLVLIGFWKMGDRRYYLCSLVLFICALIPFLLHFERRAPEPRELVTLAVMSAIAVVSRAAFIMVPHFKPLVGIVMITGMAFGPEAGFLVGGISAFVSNFLFGQGPWTPWQMFSYGMGGFLAGLAMQRGWIGPDKRLKSALFGGLCVLCIVGPLLDTSTFFTIAPGMSRASAGAIYLSGVPVNIVHGTATFLTLYFFCRPLMEKLDRIRIKYGMMEETREDEI